MSDKARGTAQQKHEDVDDRRMVAEHLNGDERAADRPNDRVDCVPGGIEPRYFVGEKFEEIKDAGNDDDPRLAENLERLITGRQRDPMKMDREAGDEDSQVKIDAGEAGQAESYRDRVKTIHGENM